MRKWTIRARYHEELTRPNYIRIPHRTMTNALVRHRLQFTFLLHPILEKNSKITREKFRNLELEISGNQTLSFNNYVLEAKCWSRFSSKIILTSYSFSCFKNLWQKKAINCFDFSIIKQYSPISSVPIWGFYHKRTINVNN